MLPWQLWNFQSLRLVPWQKDGLMTPISLQYEFLVAMVTNILYH